VRFPGRRLVVLFQPHQHHRLRSLFDGFAGSFQDADEVLFADVYAVRDSAEDRALVGSRDLARAVAARGGQARATGRLEESWRVAAGAVRPGDVLLALGAGDIGERIDELARELSGVC
jgi:UDP-N-acetylmuramate--alanine ligase